jgi:hypothetical protein
MRESQKIALDEFSGLDRDDVSASKEDVEDVCYYVFSQKGESF